MHTKSGIHVEVLVNVKKKPSRNNELLPFKKSNKDLSNSISWSKILIIKLY